MKPRLALKSPALMPCIGERNMRMEATVHIMLIYCMVYKWHPIRGGAIQLSKIKALLEQRRGREKTSIYGYIFAR
jgi:hypothetical protein